MSNTDSQALDRFKLIDFLLYFKGGFMRSELVAITGIGEATASRTAASFMEKNPESAQFLGSRKGHIASFGYAPLFEHEPELALSYIAKGQLSTFVNTNVYGPKTKTLNTTLSNDIVSSLTRGIVQSREVAITYVSTTSGEKVRIVSPHSIFSAGGYWYFRGFDEQSGEFRTFKFSRVSKATDMWDSTRQLTRKQLLKEDKAWNRLRSVQLAPHPKHPTPDAQSLDLGIKDEETKELMISEALLGFVLTDLRVDCSKKRALSCHEYPLVLLNRDNLDDVESMIFAPGFK
jgi:hypothetical protein